MKILICEADDFTKSYLADKFPGHEPEFVVEPAQDLSEYAGVEVLCVFVNSRITSEVLGRFKSLRLVVTRSTGYDHIDLEACKQRSVMVSNVPSYGEHTVAEYTFALLLDMSRKIYAGIRRVKEDGHFHTEGLTGFDLQGKVLGVVGTGRIGVHVVEIARALDMQVIAYDPKPNLELEHTHKVKYMRLEELLKLADVVTLHVPYLPATHHLLNDKTFGQMKQSAYLVNTARGGLVDTVALVSALQTGHLSGAALDVLEEENMMGDEYRLFGTQAKDERMASLLAGHALLSMPNVLVTPHNAFNTTEAKQRILDTSVQNILSLEHGDTVNLVKQG